MFCSLYFSLITLHLLFNTANNLITLIRILTPITAQSLSGFTRDYNSREAQSDKKDFHELIQNIEVINPKMRQFTAAIRYHLHSWNQFIKPGSATTYLTDKRIMLKFLLLSGFTSHASVQSAAVLLFPFAYRPGTTQCKAGRQAWGREAAKNLYYNREVGLMLFAVTFWLFFRCCFFSPCPTSFFL